MIIKPLWNYPIIEPHLQNGKLSLIMLTKCISVKNFEETRSIYSPSNNIEVFKGSDKDNIIEQLFKLFLKSKTKRIYS